MMEKAFKWDAAGGRNKTVHALVVLNRDRQACQLHVHARQRDSILQEVCQISGCDRPHDDAHLAEDGVAPLRRRAVVLHVVLRLELPGTRHRAQVLAAC